MTKILLIDDSLFTLHTFRAIAQKEGCEVTTAEGGEEALQKFSEVSPDIILCDLMMPGMNGFEVLASIKQAGLNTVFLFMTADIQETTKNKALGLGANGFISKPLTSEILKEVLNKYGKQ